MKLSTVAGLVLIGLLMGCASSSITPLSRNSAMISTTAAPVCGTTGAATVAQQMAAIATLRQGYSRFVVAGFGTANNTQVVTTGPTSATTRGTVSSFGNTAFGNSTTTFGGQRTSIRGSNDAQMQVIMLNPGDPGYEQGLDAKSTLGADWAKKLEDGVPNCF